ncbi:uncharacterized protein [Centruroides vittatus]|uniref:uncharacterized protein n=1 Tax=Centruroides vittatus TaxID=120091 RepID=UPI00350F198E
MGYERIHGGHGVGEPNKEEESILGFAVAFDLEIVNSFFTKQESHLITFNSGPHSSQIDYILTRREHLATVINCKVIPTDQVLAQHWLMCIDMKLRMYRKSGNTQMKKIKWFRLREERARAEYVERVLLQISQEWEGMQDWWAYNAQAIRNCADEVLGVTSGKIRVQKEGWWWNENVQQVFQVKKEAKRKWDRSRTEEDRFAYKTAKREAKRVVAQAKAGAYANLYEELDTREGQKKIYRLAKIRDRATKDISHIRQIKDTTGTVLRRENDIREGWRAYFEGLLNTENETKNREKGSQNMGMVQMVTREEVERALKRMKNGKAEGPDGIPVEV